MVERHPRINLPRELKAAVWEFTHGQCWYCGTDCNPYGDLCIDHVVPLARGGTNEIENLVPCCTHCNQMKGTQLVDEWRQNFDRAEWDSALNEIPWCDPSGVFWFERDTFFTDHRDSEIRAYRRWNGGALA